MTREEAIADIRDNIKPVVGGISLDMAIEALEQQLCDDCISRQEAINCVTFNEFRYRIVEDIKTLPSVTPMEKTGRWVNEKWYGTDLIGVTCSNCHVVESRFSAYCPNCGAKMEEVSE